MSLVTYKKRSGTSDRGKDYEWLLCAFYSLSFSISSDVIDFELFANNEFFGDFDDVSIRVKFSDGSIKIFLLQLKHSERTKTLALNSLTSATGDFSFFKYQKSYQNVISLKNFYFILYVNKTANFKDKTKLTLGSQDVYIRQHSCIGSNLLTTSKARNCSVFRFETDSNENFFSKFYLYVNQQNDTALKQSISDLLKTRLHSDIYNTFVEFMRGWWAGNFKLTKYDVLTKLAELVLSPMVRTLSGEKCNEKTKLLEQIILNFDLTLVDGQNNSSNIAKIWSNTTPQDIKKVSLTALKFGLTTKGISKMEELSKEKQAKVLWFMNESPLLIEVDISKKDVIDAVILLLGNCNLKKQIILLGYPSIACFTNWTVFKDLSDVSEADDLRRIITESLSVSLQGKEVITLYQLGAFVNNVASVFRVNQLLELAVNSVFNIGEVLEVLPPTYVPRSFYKILLSYNVIDDLKKSKILLSYNDQKNIAEAKFNKRAIDISNPDRRLNFFKYNIFVNDEEFPQNDVTKELASESTTHHFRVFDGHTLQWLASNDKIDELEAYRKLHSSHIFRENEVDLHFQNKIRILTSHTGTGKTSFLNRLKNESLPHIFVLKISLRDHSEFFQNYQESTVWNYIVEFTATKRNYNNFEKELLQIFNKNNVTVLWDGLDELQIASVRSFTKAVNELYSLGVTQWIAAQTRFQEILEKIFKVFAMTLVPFTQEEQIFYIQNRCNVSDDTIMKNFFENMKIIDNQEYLGVPLQLFVLTEIFSKDARLLESIYSLTDMFSAFIEGRYNHFLSRSENLKNWSNLWGLIEDAKSHRLEQYKIAGLKTHLPDLFKEMTLKITPKFLTEMKSGDFLGIIETVDEKGNFVFEHQILGEFLAALYLTEHLPSGLEHHIFQHKTRNVRFMFDLLLAASDPTFVALLYGKFEDIKNVVVTDKGGRNPLQLICSYGQRHPVLEEEIVGDQCKINTDIAAIVQKDKENLKKAINSLSKIYSPYSKDELFNWDTFDYADNSLSLGLFECFDQDFKSILPKLKNYSPASILYYSIRLDYLQMFNSIDELPYVEDTKGGNLIHVATQFDREIYLSRLLRKKAYSSFINKLNKDNWSPLHIATFNGNLSLVKFLLKNGATFMLREPSVMSIAAFRGRKDFIEFFLSCGCSPNEFYHSNHFTTSIFQAIDQKHEEIVDMLLKNGAKLYCINRPSSDDQKPNPYGMNLFHLLLENEQFEEAEAVLQKGIHIDSIDNLGNTAFHHAASKNQVSVLRFLLAKGGNPKILSQSKRSPLHFAASADACDVVKILLDESVDINLQDEEGLTALHTAVLSGNIKFVKCLLDEGIDCNLGNKYGRTPLHLAAMYDSLECVKLLCTYGAELEAKDTMHGRTPLHLAAQKGSEQCVQIFLDKGVKVDCCCNFGFTPLHLAVEDCNRECCEVLLKAGASVFVVNRNGHTPLNLLKCGYLHICRLLTLYDPVPLHSAVSRKDMVFIEELLSQDFDINATDENGNTALHIAVSSKNALFVVQYLLDVGIDVKKQNHNGFTPLHLSIQNDYFDEKIVKLLLEADAGNSTINCKTYRDVTPLHLATQAQLAAVVELLLQKGANTEIGDDLGFTPLHYAAANGDLETVTLLVNVDLQVNRTTKAERTPLHFAASRGHLNVVEFLLDHQAAVNVKDSDGDTPLDDALKAERSEIFKLLLTKTSDFNIFSTYLGRTILHVAAKNGSLHLVKFFLDKNVPLDSVDFDGSTALDEALFNRHYDVFNFLWDKSHFDVHKYSKRYTRYPIHVVTVSASFDLTESFLKRGARVDVADDDGNTPLHLAVECNNLKIFTLLLEYGEAALDFRNKRGETVLHVAMKLDRKDFVSLLMEQGANPNILDDNANRPFDLVFHCGELKYLDVLFKMTNFNINKRIEDCNATLLHLAVHYEHFEAVEWLTNNDASINCEDHDGDTPLHYAVLRNPAILSLLLEKYKQSINIERTNRDGETVLHLAAAHSLDNVKKLLKIGASPNATTKYGATPLYYALKNPKCFKFLWQLTPEVEVFNLTGHMSRNVLHYAAYNGDLESVKFFLDVGLKINEVDNRGKTPLNEAAECGDLRIMQVLLERDVDHVVINICNKNGESLLHLAVYYGNSDLVKLLLKNQARRDLHDICGQTAEDYALERGNAEICQILTGFQRKRERSACLTT